MWSVSHLTQIIPTVWFPWFQNPCLLKPPPPKIHFLYSYSTCHVISLFKTLQWFSFAFKINPDFITLCIFWCLLTASNLLLLFSSLKFAVVSSFIFLFYVNYMPFVKPGLAQIFLLSGTFYPLFLPNIYFIISIWILLYFWMFSNKIWTSSIPRYKSQHYTSVRVTTIFTDADTK